MFGCKGITMRKKMDHLDNNVGTPTLRSTSSAITSSTASSRRNRISQKSLHPTNGTLKCRLDRSLPHWPEEAVGKNKANKYCQLHNWASSSSDRKFKSVFFAKYAMLTCVLNRKLQNQRSSKI